MNKEVVNDSVRTPQTEYNQSLNMTRGQNYNYDNYRTSQSDYLENSDLFNSQVDVSNRQVNNSSEQINHRIEQRNSIRNEVNNSVRTSQAEYSENLSREATEIKKQDS